MPKFKSYNRTSIQESSQWRDLPPDIQEAVIVVSKVLPFKVNQYVMDEFIDWNNIPDDPIYRLTFPHREMLSTEEYERLRELLFVKQDEKLINEEVAAIRLRMNPHPAGQMTHNVPMMNNVPVRGLQHKYKETVLFFPSAGQTCH